MRPTQILFDIDNYRCEIRKRIDGLYGYIHFKNWHNWHGVEADKLNKFLEEKIHLTCSVQSYGSWICGFRVGSGDYGEALNSLIIFVSYAIKHNV